MLQHVKYIKNYILFKQLIVLKKDEVHTETFGKVS